MRHLGAVLIPVALLACNQPSTSPDASLESVAESHRSPESASVQGTLLYALQPDNLIFVVGSGRPDETLRAIKVKGLRGRDETLIGIDFRPSDLNADGIDNVGRLYGVSTAGTVYTIALPSGDASFASQINVPLEAGSYGIGFNPVPDRLRVHVSTGQNLRVNVDNGVTLVDGSLRYDPLGPDAGRTAALVGTAYTNSDSDPATGTVLYAIDAAAGALVTLPNANAGLINTVGSLGQSTSGSVGFDIVGTAGGTAFVTLSSVNGNGRGRGATKADLFSVSLTTGAATRLGTLGGAAPIGLAIAP